MRFEWGYLFGMALQTVPQPRVVARDLFDVDLDRRSRWEILALLLTGLAFFAVIASILFPVPVEDYGPLIANPMYRAAGEAVVAVTGVFGIYWVGRLFGGTGRFDDALTTMSWVQFVALVIEIGVLALGLFAPGLAVLLWLMGFVMTFWILSHFLAEMHGFQSAGVVFAGILMTLLVALVVLSAISAIFIGAPAQGPA